MQISDVVADLITRIRNAGKANHETVDVPASKLKKSIVEILIEEGYIKSFKLIEDDKQGVLRVTLKYSDNKKSVITGIKRISKPGLRVYANKNDIPRVLGGLGTAIISTSKGIMTDRSAKKAQICGEVMVFVW